MNREIRYKFHSSAVKVWIDKIDPKVSHVLFLAEIQKSISSVMALSLISISEVTLSAILDRVLYNSSEQYPFLNSIKVRNSELDYSSFSISIKSISREDLCEGFHFLITEYFSIIGNITNEQLTPLLYQALAETTKKIPNKKDSP